MKTTSSTAPPAPPVELNECARKALRGRGHGLRPVVLVGKGNLTPSVIDAVDAALFTHELVKVRLLQACTLEKDSAATALSRALSATLIQRVGRTILLYRPRPVEAE